MMIEVRKNLWAFPDNVVKVITTNGDINRKGELVMGRGCAKEAAERWPELPSTLAWLVGQHGNHCYYIDPDLSNWDVTTGASVISFPVKHHWNEKADLALIKRSVEELKSLMQHQVIVSKIVMPRPGCGNGRLLWKDVKPMLEDLPDRVYVVHK